MIDSDHPLSNAPAVSPRLEPRDRVFEPLTALQSGVAPAVANQPSTDPSFTLSMEEAVIGTVLAYSTAPYIVADILRPEHFLDEALGATWNAITEMLGASMKVDVFSLRSYVTQHGLTAFVPDQARLVTLSIEALHPDHARTYAERVIDGYGARKLIHAAQRVHAIARQPGDTRLRYARATEELFNAEREAFSGLSIGPQPIAAALPTLHRQMEEARDAGGVMGLSTSFRYLDEQLGGIGSDDLVIVAGRPGMGKSTIAANIADAVSITRGPVLIHSGEMSREQLLMRVIAARAEIDTHKIRTGTLTQAEWDRFAETAGRLLHNVNLIVDDKARPTLNKIIATSRATHARTPLSAIVVDHLQLIVVEGLIDNPTLALTESALALKGLAKDLKVPVIALSQLNRGVEQRDDKRPRMSDLKQSGGLEENSDTVVLMYRDQYYNGEQSSYPGLAEAIIGKSRHGKPGTVYLEFQGEYSRFRDIEPHRVPTAPTKQPLRDF